MTDKINLLLNDRESGSVALLNRLISALEEELQDEKMTRESFRNLVITLRDGLGHFAAIENFLALLIRHAGQEHLFPGESLRFIESYLRYWQDSAGRISENFLRYCKPNNLTILTHSHSETIISLLSRLHNRKIHFRVLQTISAPGEEGRKAHERLLQQKLQADLVDDLNIEDAVSRCDLILLGCDALLETEFLNKVGTLTILEQAKLFHKPSFLITESRKVITAPEWKKGLKTQTLFEWVPLYLIGRIIEER